MSEAKRTALIVLGMHRSGTSALGGVLARLGAAAPKTMMPPTQDNPRGYMESVRFMKFHDGILASSGSRWNDWGEFNPEWVGSAAAEAFRERLPELLEEEFGDARMFLLKDPRICRFFPFWVRACEELGIAVKAVIPIRHPLEVAQSLGARNRFGRSRSLLIWLRHVLDAEHASRDTDRCFVRYADLLEDWRSEVSRMARQLDLGWPRMSSQTEVEIDGHLESELRRQRVDAKRLDHGGELMSWVKAAAQALDRLVEAPHGDGKAQEILDGIKAEFDRTSQVYGAAVHEEVAEAESSANETVSQLREASAKSEQLAKRAEEAESELAASVGELQAARAAATQASTQADKNAAEQASRIDELKAQLAVKEKRLLVAEEALSRLSLEGSDLRDKVSSLLEDRGKHEIRSRKELETAQLTIQGLEASIEELAPRILSLETKNLSLQEREKNSSRELALLANRLLAAREKTEHLLDKIATLDKKRATEVEGLSKRLLAAQEKQRQLQAAYANTESRLMSEIGAQKRTIEAQVRTNELLARQVEEFRHSTSWRITAPMRGLSLAVRSLTKRSQPSAMLPEKKQE